MQILWARMEAANRRFLRRLPWRADLIRNAELAEDNPFRKDFEESTAQMFVLLMDSLDIMLGDKELGDDSLFLNDDKNIWNMLAHARCWGEVLSREEPKTTVEFFKGRTGLDV